MVRFVFTEKSKLLQLQHYALIHGLSAAVSCLFCLPWLSRNLLLPSHCVSVYVIGWGRGFFHWGHLLSVLISVKEEASLPRVAVFTSTKKIFTPTFTLVHRKFDYVVCAHAPSVQSKATVLPPNVTLSACSRLVHDLCPSLFILLPSAASVNVVCCCCFF